MSLKWLRFRLSVHFYTRLPATLLGMRGFSLTEGTMGLRGSTRKRFGCSGALALGWLRWRDRLAPDGGGVRSQPAEQEEEPHQSDEAEFVEKEG
jgi:hypothetical protein